MSSAKERPMAQTLQIDTLEFSRRMKEGGVDEKAAETIAKTVAEAIGSSDMATGTQLELTRMELKSGIDKVDTKIDKVRTELKSEIAEVRVEIGRVDAKIEKVDNKIGKIYNKIDEVQNKMKKDMNSMLFTNVTFVAIVVGLVSAFFKYVL